MRRIFLLLVILLCNTCFGQNWTVLKIDSNLSMRLPPYRNLIDTVYYLGITEMRSVVAFIDSGRVGFAKGPYVKEAEPIKNEKKLLEFYDGVKEGLMKTSKGKLLLDTIIEIAGLKMQRLKIGLLLNGRPYTMEYIGFLLNSNKYSISVMEDDFKKKKLGKEILSLFVLSGFLNIRNQFTQ